MSSKKNGAPPNGKRQKSARETESRILRAAEEIFGRKGYAVATVEDIVERAQISRGAFYLYFTNKDDVFTSVISRVVDDLYTLSGTQHSGTFRERVEAANRGYLEAYNRNRRILRCLMQVSTFNPRIAALHNKARKRFFDRIRRHLERNIEAGYCHPMNPAVTAYALGLMMERVAYYWLSVGYQPWPERFDLETLVQEVTNLWCRAVYRDGKGNRMPDARTSTQTTSADSMLLSRPRTRETAQSVAREITK